jgi:hypothetical protein
MSVNHCVATQLASGQSFFVSFEGLLARRFMRHGSVNL